MWGVSQTVTVPTGLLTDKQRAFLRGEREDESEDPGQYENQLRYEAKERADQMLEDLELLEAEGHEDIVMQFYWHVGRLERIRRAIADLEADRDGTE